MKAKWLVGVDEAGRGPLAGPVSVGVVVVPVGFDWRLIEGVGDSKQIKPENREAIFRRAQDLRHHRKLNFAVSMVGSSVIDEKGISYAIKLAMKRCFDRLDLGWSNFPRLTLGKNHETGPVKVLLDGGLRAPVQFFQETIIKGDAIEPSIGLASIVAKVTRDRYMIKMAKRYTQFGFEQHMGYGTRAHRQAIAQYGKCPIHRVSYCKNIKSL